jgi:hypothetical protein
LCSRLQWDAILTDQSSAAERRAKALGLDVVSIRFERKPYAWPPQGAKRTCQSDLSACVAGYVNFGVKSLIISLAKIANPSGSIRKTRIGRKPAKPPKRGSRLLVTTWPRRDDGCRTQLTNRAALFGNSCSKAIQFTLQFGRFNPDSRQSRQDD